MGGGISVQLFIPLHVNKEIFCIFVNVRLSGKVLQSPCLEGFRSHLNKALSNLI